MTTTAPAPPYRAMYAEDVAAFFLTRGLARVTPELLEIAQAVELTAALTWIRAQVDPDVEVRVLAPRLAAELLPAFLVVPHPPQTDEEATMAGVQWDRLGFATGIGDNADAGRRLVTMFHDWIGYVMARTVAYRAWSVEPAPTVEGSE